MTHGVRGEGICVRGTCQSVARAARWASTDDRHGGRGWEGERGYVEVPAPVASRRSISSDMNSRMR